MKRYKVYILMVAGCVALSLLAAVFTAGPVAAQLVKAALVQDVDQFSRRLVTVRLPYTVPDGKRFDMVHVSLLAPAGLFGGVSYTSLGNSVILYVWFATDGAGGPVRGAADPNTVVSFGSNPPYLGAVYVTGALINYP